MPTTDKVNGSDPKVLETVGKLIALANGADEEEARTAAMQATKLMKQHELVLVPRAEIERVQKLVEGARALATTQKAETQQKMIIAGIAGMLLSKSFKF